LRAYQLDPVSGVRLVGGEMLQWSDFTPGATPGVSPLLLRHLLARAAFGQRILALGPRAARHLEQLPSGSDVDVLVRGLPDARELTNQSQLRDGITVYCGGLDRFEADGPYDVIVVLDGPGVLLTPDSTGSGVRELLQRLAKWLAPTGTFVAMLENDLGLDRLLRLQVREHLDADRAWERGAEGFDQRPLYLREVAHVLGDAGITSTALYAAFPTAEKIDLLVDDSCGEDTILSGTAAALAASVEATHFSNRPALVDPYDLSLRLFESGQVMSLASAWVVIGRPSAAALSSKVVTSGSANGTLPALLMADQPGRPEWAVVRTVEQVDGRWQHQLRPEGHLREMRERRVVRHFDDLPSEYPSGPTLEATLRRASSAHDVGLVRELVVRYSRWLQATPSTTGDGDPRFFAVPSRVVVTGESLMTLDLTWRLTASLPHDVLLVRGLRDFARRLLRSGAEHPWAAGISPDRLTQTLGAMAGVEVSTSRIEAVARLEAEVRVTLAGSDAAAESLEYASNLDAGRSQFVSQAGPVRGYREALALSGRLAQDLDVREQQVGWLQDTLRARDHRLADLERQFDDIRASFSFRVGRFLTWPGRAIVQLVRRVALSAIPHGLVSKAMKLAERMARRV
jgi:hypothetical protein